MDAETALAALHPVNDLTILSLSGPILNPPPTANQTRTSDASDTASTLTPTLLAADLAHYRDLFSKLRFSYVEQVTKERFLKALVSDPPEFVDGKGNAELEAKLRVDKAGLKERKEEVRVLVGELEEQGRSLAGRES